MEDEEHKDTFVYTEAVENWKATEQEKKVRPRTLIFLILPFFLLAMWGSVGTLGRILIGAAIFGFWNNAGWLIGWKNGYISGYSDGVRDYRAGKLAHWFQAAKER